MEKRQENRQTMWEAVEKVLDDNQEAVDTVPAFAQSVQKYKTKSAEARLKQQDADKITKGKTKSKMETIEALHASLIPAISTLRVYARKEHKTELEAKISYSPSDLRAMRDTELKDIAGTIIALIDQEAPGLAQHGLTADKIALLKSRYAAYCSALSGKEGSFAERAGLHESTDALVAEVNSILSGEIDEYMDLMAADAPEFYAAYWSARHIHMLGVRHKQAPAAAEQEVPAK